MRHENYIKLALKQASKVIRYQHNIGAVLVRGGSVLAKSVNCYDNGMHAETRALLSCKGDVTGSILYVARYMRSKEFGLARPCLECQKMIANRGIRMVVYTDNMNTFGIWKPIYA